MDEKEKSKRPRGTGSIYQPKRSRFLWVKYYRNGTAYRESTHTTDGRKAQKFLQNRLGEITTGNFLGPAIERIRVSELAEDMFRDYRINMRRSLKLTKARWKLHLQPMFGQLRACEATTELLNRYADGRKTEGAENATINREFAALKRMYGLGYRSTPRKVLQIPAFPRLKENPPRRGFVEQKPYQKLCEHSPHLWLRTLISLGYTFGFRLAELLKMRVRQVDLLNRLIVLDPGTTKNDEGRIISLTSETYELVKQCMLSKGPDDFLFARSSGQRVKDFRTTWTNLTKAAGLSGLLFHDLRRSAVRNMVRRGVPEVVAMRISGHKTRSVFDRYNIVNESDLAEAALRIEQGSLRESGHSLGTHAGSERNESDTGANTAQPKQ